VALRVVLELIGAALPTEAVAVPPLLCVPALEDDDPGLVAPVVVKLVPIELELAVPGFIGPMLEEPMYFDLFLVSYCRDVL